MAKLILSLTSLTCDDGSRSQQRWDRLWWSFFRILRRIRLTGPAFDWMEDDHLKSENNYLHIDAMIGAMTPEERRLPEIIRFERQHRIADGSGMPIQYVQGLIRFLQTIRNDDSFESVRGRFST